MKITNTVRLPVDRLDPLPGNREFGSGMDEKSLRELAESIRAHGIQQDLLVRPHPTKKDRYEIFAGVRRWTAAKQLKLTEVPCKVREVNDAQARELRLIENLQREGVHEMEEARGYEELLGMRDPQGKPLHTTGTIARQIGKSEAYVYAKLKLLRMPDIAQEAFLADKLNASVALLLSRIPDSKLAHKATLEVLDPASTGWSTPDREKRALDPEIDPMSFRRAKDHIQQNYMKRLKGAKFDQEDAKLLPVQLEKPAQPGQPDERVAGGACGDCPLRTGNLKKLFPALYGDVESADVCTNPACFKLKETAAARIEQQKYKAKGQVLAGEGKARQLVNTYNSNPELTPTARDQFVDLKEKVPGKRQTWEEVLDDHLPEDAPDTLVVRAESYTGVKKTFHLLPINETVLAAAKAAGVKLDKPKPNSNGAEQRAKEEADRKAASAKSQAVVASAHPVLLAAMAKRKPEENLRFYANECLARNNHYLTRNGHKNANDLAKAVAKMSLAEMVVALADSLVHQTVHWQGDLDEDFTALCKEFGVDLKEITKQVEANANKATPETKTEPAAKK
jgi:ParB/RepB/Spo0J family partition protein